MVNWARIFKDNLGWGLDTKATLNHIDKVVREWEWTDETGNALDSIIYREETVNDLAKRLDVSTSAAAEIQNLGYRALQEMVTTGMIEPIYKHKDTA